MEGSRSVQIFTDPDPDPDPGGPITWGMVLEYWEIECKSMPFAKT
jgi:hypothetical protein